MARGIDHLVVAVRDLDVAARFYERLGFRVGNRNRHPWGTENRLIQFPGTFIEIITVGEGASIAPHGPRFFSFGAFILDYLSRREGLAMLVLDSQGAKEDAAQFAGAAIGDYEPFFFERKGLRPDGSETHVAFTLAFARDEAAPGMGYFVCQHHFPENFWNRKFQDHPNHATTLSTVAAAAPSPARHERFLARLTGGSSSGATGEDLSFTLSRGRLDVVTLDDAGEIYGSVEEDPGQPSFVAFAVRVEDVDRQASCLAAAEIPYNQIGSRLIVPASAAFGVAIAFEPD